MATCEAVGGFSSGLSNRGPRRKSKGPSGAGGAGGAGGAEEVVVVVAAFDAEGGGSPDGSRRCHGLSSAVPSAAAPSSGLWGNTGLGGNTGNT